ncbi:MAG: hypothetical protein DI539_15775 [Flavobacterium psychrophilum]|nr:MAG: hypothetical protein DI539_15775 [Flavobacterium psychrophilum]
MFDYLIPRARRDFLALIFLMKFMSEIEIHAKEELLGRLLLKGSDATYPFKIIITRHSEGYNVAAEIDILEGTFDFSKGLSANTVRPAYTRLMSLIDGATDFIAIGMVEKFVNEIVDDKIKAQVLKSHQEGWINFL